MNVLFLSYWSLREPLNASAVFPYLRILSERSDIEKIHFVTLETAKANLPEVHLDIPKVEHTALHPLSFLPHLLSKAFLFLASIPYLLIYIKRNRIRLVIAKASIAGTIADIVNSINGIPYNVESFEPHSIYMLECNVWKKNSIRYRFSRYMEKRQIRRARYIVTVTNNHRNDLIASGVATDRIHTIPSITDLAVFKYDAEAGAAARKELGIPLNAKAAIYVGKFGGLYYDEEAFLIFARAIAHFGVLHIIVLSPSEHDKIIEKARNAGIPDSMFHITTVMHVDVPRYLSAADFAFSTIRPSPIKRYQCPIKNGEYWACGLPILMTDEVSDDHIMMRSGIGGSTYAHDLSDLDHAITVMDDILKDPAYRTKMRELARQLRSVDIAERIYRTII